jgi:hypothetical protein
VAPDELRAWSQKAREAEGSTTITGETPEEELRRLQLEVAVLRQVRPDRPPPW